LVKIYELEPYVNLLDINEKIALYKEEEAIKIAERPENINLLINNRDFARSFYIPY